MKLSKLVQLSRTLPLHGTDHRKVQQLVFARHKFSFVPEEPQTISRKQVPKEPVITEDDIVLLERLSLVDFGNKQGVLRLTEAIKFADYIREVNTDGIEPLYTVQEDRCLPLRDDQITDTLSADQILSCAAVTEDEYFVAPPGNVPLEVVNTYTHDADDADSSARPSELAEQRSHTDSTRR